MDLDPRNLSRNVSLEEYLLQELGPKHTDITVAISMTLVYALLLITGVIGNICTCVVISRNKYMHTATNYYLFSLAVSDLLLLVMGLPQEVYQLWIKYPYIFGEVFCIFRGHASETSTNASILTITAFTVERYVAICHPLKAHTMSKLTRAIKFIIGIWCIGALFAIPVVIPLGIVTLEHDGVEIEESTVCVLKREVNHAFEISTGLFFILPMTLISILYVLISVQLRRTSIHKSENKLAKGKLQVWQQKTFTVKIGIPANKSSTKRIQNSRRAVIKMLVAVVVAFFLCWAPFHAQRLMAIYVTTPTPTDELIYIVLTYISGVTYYVSATINPILYSILSVKFRQAFKETLARCCRRRSRRRDASYSFRYQSTIRTTTGYEASDLSSNYDSPRRRTERIIQYPISPNKASHSKSAVASLQRPELNGNKINHVTS